MDLDGDGIKDILSGNYVTDREKGISRVYLLKGKGDGTYEKATEVLNSGMNPIIAAPINDRGDDYNTGQICTHPFAADWDADGDLDLIIGNFDGSFSLVVNEMQGKGMKYQANEKVSLIKTNNGKILHCGSAHSAPFVIDWDNDGDLDLLSSTVSIPLMIARNVGTKTKPEFESFEILIAKPISDFQSAYRPWIADVNNDGKLDVLIGDKYVEEKPNPQFAPEEISKMEKEWKEELAKLIQDLQPLEEEFLKQFKEGKEHEENFLEEYRAAKQALMIHNMSRQKFINITATGNVWLYLAK